MNQATLNLPTSLSPEQLQQLCTDSGYLEMEFYSAEFTHTYKDSKGEHVFLYSTVCDDPAVEGTLRGHVYVVLDPSTGDLRVDF